MEYVVLLRGINVGGNHKVGMSEIKELFESLGYSDVSTYINSGNIFLTSDENKKEVLNKITNSLKKNFSFDIPTLVKTKTEIKEISQAIPDNWSNDKKHKTDVAYLFDQIDFKNIIDQLPVKTEFLDIKYVKGALIIHVERKNYNKSQLNKIVSTNIYKLMTLRNVNTARKLAQ